VNNIIFPEQPNPFSAYFYASCRIDFCLFFPFQNVAEDSLCPCCRQETWIFVQVWVFIWHAAKWQKGRSAAYANIRIKCLIRRNYLSASF